MLEFTPEECQLIANALNVLAQRDGLSQPQQYAMSTQIVTKLQAEPKGRAEAATGRDAIEADLEAGSGTADV